MIKKEQILYLKKEDVELILEKMNKYNSNKLTVIRTLPDIDIYESFDIKLLDDNEKPITTALTILYK